MSKQVSAAFVKAQRAFGPALKTNTNPHFKSKYADLAACVEAVIDALNENGIALIQRTHPDETGVTVETVLLHESGESIVSGTLHVPAAKQDPQGYGSALTYARRYSLMAACGIAPEDDDGNAGSKPQRLADKKPNFPGVAQMVAEGEAALMTGEDKQYLHELAALLIDQFPKSGGAACHQRLLLENLTNEQKMFLWANLPSNLRSALKKEAGQAVEHA